MELQNVTQSINDNLKAFDLDDWASLKETEQKQLIKLETYFKECESIYENCQSQIKGIKLDIRNISKMANVGKSTIYNSSNLIKPYVESRVAQLSNRNTDVQLKEMMESYTELKKVFENNINVFVHKKNYELEIEKLEKEIDNQRLKIEFLLTERARLNEENMKLKNELNKSKKIKILD